MSARSAGVANAMYAVNGVLLLDKPTGITSNAAIQRARRALGAAKAGHVGTLDPMASGLLPICLGEATKFSTDMFAADKIYVADLRFGVVTTTGDAEGEITSSVDADITPQALTSVMPRFTGNILQTPSMYSALKRDGKPLYAYARAGETVAREPRPIVIYAIDVLSCTGRHAQLRVHCGKGTYIRVLAEDIGAALGCGASLAGLRRTRVGAFDLAAATALDDLESDPIRAGAALLPVDSLAATLPECVLSEDEARRVMMGQTCQTGAAASSPLGGVPAASPVRLYSPQRRFLGLGELSAQGVLVPRRLVAGPA